MTSVSFESSRRPMVKAAFLLLALRLADTAFAGDAIEALWRESTSRAAYRAPRDDELERARKLFQRAFQGDDARALEEDAPALGFRVREITTEAGYFLVISEAEDRREGRGFFAVRRGDRAPVLLQAPHGFHDLHTGKIAARMLEEAPFAGAAWNTVHRGRKRGRTSSPSDLAHLEKSYFMAFLAAFADRHRGGRVIQLHGFSNDRRDTSAGERADAILSNGTETPDPDLFSRHRCLGETLGGELLVYPVDVRELGGTTNAQGRWIRERGGLTFLHLEMDLPLRKKLCDEKELRARVARCLSGDGKATGR